MQTLKQIIGHTRKQTREDFEAALTHCIEKAPAEDKRKLLEAMEAYMDARPNMQINARTEMFLEAIEEGLFEEIMARDEGETAQQ